MKNKSKSVLDYDPLAWLKETDEPEKKQAKASKKKQVIKKKAKVVKPAVKPKSASSAKAKPSPKSDKTKQNAPKRQTIKTQQEPIVEQATTDTIVLGSELSIKNIAEFKTKFDRLYERHTDINLDASELQKIDAAGLQLLYSLKQGVEKQQNKINWLPSNAIINQAAEIIGMEPLADATEEASFGFFDDEPTPNSAAEEADAGYGFF